MSQTGALWWKEKTPHDRVWAHIRQLEGRHSRSVWRDFVNERIYGSTIGMDSLKGMAASDLVRSTGFASADLNFTRTIVDALVARVGNNQPSIKFSPDGADWSQRRKAKQLDKVIEGEMEALNVAAKAPLCLRDALCTRGGLAEVGADSGRIFADRFPCEELFFDDREARYGEPRQLHRVMRVSKDVLAAKYPEKRQEIEKAPEPKVRPNDIETQSSGEAGMVEVAKSWHLPSFDGAKDGKWAITIQGATLDEGPWTRDHYPIAFLRWAPPRRGFWGSCLVDELAGLQFKVNEVARDLMQNIYFTSALKVFTRRGADVEKGHVAGKKPHFVEVDTLGQDVQFHAPDGFSPAQFQFLKWLIQQMYSVSGASETMVNSKNTLGAGASGAAQNAQYDIESERFSQLEQAYARFWRDIGRLIVEAAQDMAEDEEFKAREVRWSKKNVLHRIKWADVDLDADRYELHLEPTGFLPSTRAGKTQAIEQLIAAGQLDPVWSTTLLDYPDLKRANLVRNAPLEWVLWAMEQLEDVEIDADGDVVEEESAEMPAPDPHMDLALAVKVAKAVYQLHITEGDRENPTPDALLARYRTFIESCDAAKGAAAAAQPAPAPGMGTGGPPMPGMPDMGGGMPPPMPPDMAALPPMPPEVLA